MGEVLPFQNIGIMIEETVTFLGQNKGSMTLSYKEEKASGDVIWFAGVVFTAQGNEIRQSFTDESFNKAALQAIRFVKSVA